MSKPKPPADLWEQLDALRAKEQRPPNTFTAPEYAKRYGIPESTARHAVRQLVKAGTAEVVGCWNQVTCYRLT